MAANAPIPDPPLRARLRERRALRVLPPPVRAFYRRALQQARRDGDRFSLDSVSRPANLATLLALARGRRTLVELGTCTAWTTAALALDAPQASVLSFDPVVHAQRERYLDLIPAAARARIELVAGRGADGADRADQVELLFIDSTHQRADTVEEYHAWAPRLAPSALVVLDDYGHPDYPGVAEAVAELGLPGEQRGGLWVARPRS